MTTSTESKHSESIINKTQKSVLLSSLLHEPFLALYGWVAFILRKDLGAGALVLGILVTLKPFVSIFSFYWIAASQKRNLRLNLLTLGVLARVPFLLFFWIDQVGFVVFAAAFYLLLSRAAIAPWMEILKRNLPKENRHTIFTMGSAIGYAEGVLLALCLGVFLDMNPDAWKALFCGSSLLGILGVLLQASVPLHINEENSPTEITSLKKFFLDPWKSSYKLIRSRPDFARFQLGFMACGVGVMMVIALLPLYFVDVLQLSHLNFATARQICMGFGFLASSALWSRALNRHSISKLTFIVCLFFSLFTGCLIMASSNIVWIYIAYIIYGIAQGGSHNLWHLSGPMFAKGENSQKFVGVNVLAVGIRGLIVPSFSLLLFSFIGLLPTLIIAMFTCLFGALIMLKKEVKDPVKKTGLVDNLTPN